MATLFTLARAVKVNLSGLPYPGATITFYQTATDNLATVYQDASLGTAHPTTIAAQDDGYFPPIWLDENAAFDYRYKIISAGGVLLDDVSGVPRKPNITFTSNQLAGELNSLTLSLAEIAAGQTGVDLSYVRGNLLRYGLVPNDSTLAAANTAFLRALFDPNTIGPTGSFWLENTTGHDVYHFSSPVPHRDNLHVDLQGCTINYTGAATSADANSGLFFLMRDCTVQNGTINVAVDTSGSSGSGYAIQLGARTTDSSYFTVYDSLLSKPMGNITLKNLRINLTNTGSHLSGTGGIGGLGGLENVIIENVVIDGGGNASGGIVYEFGWATNESDPSQRQTSHAHNWTVTNVTVQNLDTSIGIGVVLGGMYSAEITNLKVVSAANAIHVTPGESLFYRPWTGHDNIGAKRAIKLNNITGVSLSGNGISIDGAQAASGGYLGTLVAGLSHPADYLAQTDLEHVSIDGFALQCAPSGWGIFSSAASIEIKNGKVTGGCEHGIVLTNECTIFSIDAADVFSCTSFGLYIGLGSPIWSPNRLPVGTIAHCRISGNGVSAPGTLPGIQVESSKSVKITQCRIGLDTVEDGSTETNQGSAVQLGATAQGVICDGVVVGSTAGSQPAYGNTFTLNSGAHGCAIRNPQGVSSMSGNWEIGDLAQATSANIADKTHELNTTGKFFGRKAYNSSSTKMVIAQGSTATSTWITVDAATTVTPS